MHILYVTGEALSEKGGATTHILDLSRTFVALGHKVTILSHGKNPERSEKGIRYIQRDVHWFGMTLPFLQLMHVVKNDGYDIILERYAVLGGAGYALSKAWCIPFVLESNGPHLQEAIDMGQLKNPVLISILKKWTTMQYAYAKRVFICSNCITDKYKKKLLGSNWHKGVYVKNGVLEHSQLSGKAMRKKYNLETSVVFSFIGSFKPWMGVINLVEAIRLLKEKFPAVYRKCSFLLAGEGKEASSVREFIQLHALDRCIMTGALDPEEISELLAASDVGVAPFNAKFHPTLESMGFYMSPVKIFEYMMAQKPIIASDYPEIKTMFDAPKGGMAVPAGDVYAFMLSIKNIVGVDRSKMGAYNRKKAIAQYTWKQSAKIQLQEFEKILREKC